MWSIVQTRYVFYIANANGSGRKPRTTSTRSFCSANGFVLTRYTDIELRTRLFGSEQLIGARLLPDVTNYR
jgi:hypothetical protein